VELISSLSEFLTQRRKGAEYAERFGEVGVGEWWKDVEKFMVASL
jgi:hypothetical protein